MRVDVLAILVGTLLFALLAPRLGRRLHPAVAVQLLVVGSVLVGTASLWVVTVIALTGVGQFDAVADVGRYSASALRGLDPFPVGFAMFCSAVVGVADLAAVVFLVRRGRALLRAYRRCRDLPSTGPLVILERDEPQAFATPASRIVLSTGLLRALNPDERRVVLAHEQSHLTHRHTWWRLAADLAAAGNPVLRATARTVAELIERWADEDAACAVDDRRLAARTLARTALLTNGPPPSGQLAATGGDVPARVRALLAPPPPRRPGVVVVVGALLAALAVTTIVVQRDADQLFDQASKPAIHQIRK